jgi:hypothetical protein
MAQSDQVVQNATFPTVRADINDNLAALYSQSSGPSAPTTTVAFQPWVDTSSSPPVWKIRNAANTGWITVGVLDPAGFESGGVTPIANGGTGATTAAAAINALVPSQSGNNDYFLQTNGTSVLWAAAAAGLGLQVFTSSGTFTPTAGKTTFLVFCTGGGGGSGYASTLGSSSAYTWCVSGGGGAGGTGIRIYDAAEMGSSAVVTVGGGGSGGGSSGESGGNGGTSSFNPAGTGVTVQGNGGEGSISGSIGSGKPGGAGAGYSGAQFGNTGGGGASAWRVESGSAATYSPQGPRGGAGLFGGNGGQGSQGGIGADSTPGNGGDAGIVIVFEL